MNNITHTPISVTGYGKLNTNVSERLHLIREKFAKAKSIQDKRECAAQLKVKLINLQNKRSLTS